MPETSNQAPNESAISIKTEYFALGGFILFAGFYMLTATGIGIDPSSLVAASSRTAPITMVTPNGGESWMASTTQNITWSGGDRDWVVSLYLINGERTKTVSTITRSTSNTGSYSWHIPANIPAGQYYVRIGCENCKSNVKNRVDFSDAPFNLITSGSTKGVAVAMLSSSATLRSPYEVNFNIRYRITAMGGAVYVPGQATSTLIYNIQNDGMVVNPLSSIAWGTITDIKTLQTDNGNIKIEDGQSIDFDLTVSSNATTSGYYRLSITGLRWSDEDDQPAENVALIDLRTPYVLFTP